MLGTILNIVSIFGIVLLILLSVLLLILALVLFLPIVYRADAEIEENSFKANAYVRWMFVLLRAEIAYPEPGKIKVKVFGVTLSDSLQRNPHKPKKNVASDATVYNGKDDDKTEEHSGAKAVESDKAQAKECSTDHKVKHKLFEKYSKIKYTIQTFCGNIKHIWENISFYKKLLQDEETKLLFSHTCNRIRKVLKHLWPAKIKANLIFGADSPDTTGYLYGIYCMFSTKPGKDVCIIPDFEQKILQGTVYLAGHITVFTLLVNILAVLLDKRLRLFIQRVKRHAAKQVADSGDGKAGKE